MSPSQVHLITIVAESVLEARLVRDVQACGASGWTITACLGHSSDGGGAADFEGGNIRLEVLVHEEPMERVWRTLADDYFNRYSVVAWSTPVRVERPGEYAAGP